MDNLKDGRYKCPNCTMTFTRKWGLDRHVDNIHNGIYYSCRKCLKKFPRPYLLRQHYHKDECAPMIGDHKVVKITPLQEWVEEMRTTITQDACVINPTEPSYKTGGATQSTSSEDSDGHAFHFCWPCR